MLDLSRCSTYPPSTKLPICCVVGVFLFPYKKPTLCGCVSYAKVMFFPIHRKHTDASPFEHHSPSTGVGVLVAGVCTGRLRRASRRDGTRLGHDRHRVRL